MKPMKGSKVAKIQTLVSCLPLNSLSFRILKAVDVPCFTSMCKSDIMDTDVQIDCCIDTKNH